MAGGEHFHRLKRVAREALVVRRDGTHDALREVDLAAFQHRQHLGADHVDQLHLHVGEALRVEVQEPGKDAVDEVRGGCHVQRAGVPAPQQFRPLAEFVGIVQQAAVIVEQLFACAGKDQAAPDAIE